MERHIKVARAHRALSWFYGVLVIGLVIVMFIPTGKPVPAALWGFVGVLVLIGFAHHAIARGARERTPGARVGSILISILLLCAFPLGTLIGLYLLFNTASPWEPMFPVRRDAKVEPQL
ncbi:MAG: hypothetical protein JWQ90_2535 [Hydrocarboniphaga sp.]|uniref:hypothetical protein n=1 Tax=Hydrocarboniphaga sp. TaxID=2033016 RepID=UPI0026303ACA|nr:hypothetical protein [Hydrocarboniphaga sp.]MDB5970085.1 hypothetical protein [Hydrocarboniphaga sp.]